MSHQDAQAAHGDARSFSGHIVSSFPSLGQGTAQNEIRRATGWPVRDATIINSYRPSFPSVRGNPCNYTTLNATKYQATFNVPPPMNNYTQAPGHNHRILDRGVIHHQTKSGAAGYSTHTHPPTDSHQSFSDCPTAHSASGNPHSSFTQPTYGGGSTMNNHVQAAHNDYVDHGTVQHEIESAGRSTHNHSSTHFRHCSIDYSPIRAGLASPQNDTSIPGLIQPSYYGGLTVNNYALLHDVIPFPHRGMDQQELGSIVAGRRTHNYPSTYPHYSLATHSFTNSASGDPQNVAAPCFSRATYSAMNTYLQAPCDDRRNVGFSCDALEWHPHIDRANVQHDIQSTTGWSSDNVTRHPFPRYSSAYSAPGIPQNNTIPDGTQYRATYPTIDYDPVYSFDDRGSEYHVDVRVSTCEWNDDNGPCGKNIIVRWDSIKEHVNSCHLDSRFPVGYPTQCRWKGCQLEQCIRRDTTARHVCEMHFGIKRSKSKGVRVMGP